MVKVSEAHLEARRRSIIDAACRAFSEKGVETATMAEVAARAGISPGAIYRYFDNKEALARACLSESSGAILKQWLTEPNASENPALDLRNFARLTFEVLNEPSQRAETMLDLEHVLSAARDENASAAAELRGEFMKITSGIESRLRLAQQAGQLAASVDVHVLATMLFSLYWGAAITRLIVPEADAVALIEVAWGLLWGSKAVPADQ